MVVPVVFRGSASVPFLILLATIAAPAQANRGMVPFDPGVQLFEPTQRAPIAWNGQEEILVLSTDVAASKSVKVLEVLPVPAEPTVKKGDPEIFEKATTLINSHIPKPAGPFPGSMSTRAAPSYPPAGEVTFHERIGAHDISVTHVLSAEGFCEWAEAYLRSAGAQNPQVPQSMQDIIGKYIKDGFAWFVYDVIELSDTTKTNEPIQYQFKSNCIYYPLKITRTDNPQTDISLLILSPRIVTEFPQLSIEQITMPYPPIALTAAELKFLNADVAGFLGDAEGMMLRIWFLHKRTKFFNRDLVAY